MKCCFLSSCFPRTTIKMGNDNRKLNTLSIQIDSLTHSQKELFEKLDKIQASHVVAEIKGLHYRVFSLEKEIKALVSERDHLRQELALILAGAGDSAQIYKIQLEELSETAETPT